MNDDVAGLMERLEGVYRVPITDGLGAVEGGEEPDNPNEFVRRFPTVPVQLEAASTIRAQAVEIERLRAYHLRAEEAGQRQALRADAAEAKLREAVEVMRLVQHQPMNLEIRAFLADMEKKEDSTSELEP